MRVLRRLGTSPRERGSVTNITCPDVFELDSGDFAIIGTDAPELAGSLPRDASVGVDEMVVRIPRAVLVAAMRDIPDA